jgi:hypothetical protein
MLLRLAYLGVTNVFAMLRLLPMSNQDGSVALSVGKIEADLSSEVIDPPAPVAAAEVCVRWVPVPGRGDRGGGALVSAVQSVLSRR